MPRDSRGATLLPRHDLGKVLASPSEIAVAVSRLLGFKAMSAGMREIIEQQVQTLKVKGRLSEQDGLFRIGIVP